MKLIDSHCHLDFEAFDADRQEVIGHAHAAGVTDIVIPGVSADGWEKIQMLCAVDENLHPCYGLHPYYVDQHRQHDLDRLETRVQQYDCVAIGECGLDLRRNQAAEKDQMHYFSSQLDIASAHGIPVVIHAVRATAQVIEVLNIHPALRGMIHSYSGSYEQAKQLVELGFYISLGGAITYDNAHRVRAVAARLPLSNLLIETDAPDQPDADHFSQRNEPANLLNVLDTLSLLRSESREEIAARTSENARTLFGI
jgi:TatD DNase family protein